MNYIETAHPKLTIPPDQRSIKPYLDRGWWAQPKIDGWHVQIQVNAEGRILALTRNCNHLQKPIATKLKQLILENFTPPQGRNVICGEYLPSLGEYHLFDYVMNENNLLDDTSYQSRYEMLPHSSPPLYTVPSTSHWETTDKILIEAQPFVEGLVLKDPLATGFHSHSMRRCRIPGHRHSTKIKANQE